MDRFSPIHRYKALAGHCFLNCFHVLLPNYMNALPTYLGTR